jgi:SAM-dependent methyltransferase
MIDGNDSMNLYDQNFFNENYFAETAKSANEIVRELWSIIQPASVLDVGCGIGLFLEAFSRKGVTDICGIDGDWVEADALRIPMDKFLPHDLALPLDISNHFDLAVCLEVAEHLPSEAAPVVVQSLVQAAPAVLFSAAVPQQWGVGHLNEQWPEYWAALFATKGYVAVDCIRRRIWANEKVLWWYKQNTILFVENDYLQSDARLKAEFEKTEGMPLAVIHPEAFLHHLESARTAALSADVSFRSLLSHGRRWAMQRCRNVRKHAGA